MGLVILKYTIPPFDVYDGLHVTRAGRPRKVYRFSSRAWRNGSRTGLKIPGPRVVWVRLPPPALCL